MEKTVNPDFEKYPFSSFLEACLSRIYTDSPDTIAILTRKKSTGKVNGYYYSVFQEDGALFTQKLLLDQVLHMLESKYNLPDDPQENS